MSHGSQDFPALDGELRTQIVAKIADTVRECYVFQEDACQYAEALLRCEQEGGFDSIETIPELMSELNRTLQETKEDLHLAVLAWLPPEEEADVAADNTYKEWLDGMPRRNFDFRKLEILLGNVGYLDLRSFCPADIGGETATAAMQFLAHTDALIFDLRDNGGGDSLVQYLQSYLFSEPTHMLSNRYQPDDRVEQTWTYAYVPGPRFANVPVYVLMSKTSFSAAEDFAYTLQLQKRATIVGEQTRGGAHPVEFYRFPELFLEIMIPNACSEDPITGGNWEDTGVIPDVVTSADDALTVAHEHILETLLKTEAEQEAVRQWTWALERIRGLKQPIDLDATDLSAYAGAYGRSIFITQNEGVLRFCWGGRRSHPMTPLGDHLFEFDHGNQRARFNIEDGVPRTLLVSDYAGGEWTLPRREVTGPDPVV